MRTPFIIQDPIRWSPLTDVEDGYSPTLPHLKGLQNGDTATSAIKQVKCKKMTFFILLVDSIFSF
jgi:hypothetical protein